MRDLAQALAEPGTVLVGGAPDGRDALAISDLRAQTPDMDLIFVARDDARLRAFADALKLFAPDASPMVFPAWDCLPYDRASPHTDICAERLICLSRLADPNAPRGRLVLTTIGAITQRVEIGRAHV